MSDAPEGFIRAKDGVLELKPGETFIALRNHPREAVRVADKFLCWEFVVSGQWSNEACQKTAKHDPDQNGNPTRCGVHCAEAKAKRKAKGDAKCEKRRADIAKKSANENTRLRKALTTISEGDGVYGAQAWEYKQIARAALEDDR